MIRSVARGPTREWRHAFRLTALLLALCLVPGCSVQPGDGDPLPPPPPPAPPGPLPPPPPPETVTATITVDTTTRFQTMSGWEAVTQSGQDEPGFAGWQQQLLAGTHDHFKAPRLPVGVGTSGGGRGGNCSATGSSTMTWLEAETKASGTQ